MARGLSNLIDLAHCRGAGLPFSNAKKATKKWKLWGGRFEEGPSEVFERFCESLHFDPAVDLSDIRARRR